MSTDLPKWLYPDFLRTSSSKVAPRVAVRERVKAIHEFSNIYISSNPTDMRKSITGLSTLVQEELEKNLFSSSLFIFMNQKRNILKILYWDKTGFAIWLKKLEKEKFPKPPSESKCMELSEEELNSFLSGINVWRQKPHATLPVESFIF